MRTRSLCLALGLSALVVDLSGCSSRSSDSVTRHAEYPRLRREMADLVQLIRNSSDLELYKALSSLAAYDVFAVETAVELLSDPNPRIRSNGVWVLGQIPHDDSYPVEEKKLVGALERSLKDPDRLVRYEAASALVLRNDWGKIPLLFQGLRDEDAAVRMRCNESLRLATSLDLGFRVDAPLEDRESAIGRWQTWYQDWQRTSG